VEECEDGWFGNEEGMLCEECVEGCATCEDLDECTSCTVSHPNVGQDGFCYDICPDSYSLFISLFTLILLECFLIF